MVLILNYWMSSKDDLGNVYSCDMIRIVFNVRFDCTGDIDKYFNSISRTDITKYPTNFSSFKYRELFIVDYGLSTMTIGIGFNGSKSEDNMRGFVEFNPNKVDCEQFELDYDYLKGCVKHIAVSRWDLAIDVPGSIEFFSLIKDQRHYSLEMSSRLNKTEYLGARNKAGRFKMYNKSLESNLDYDLTRLELTCDGMWGVDDIISHFPETYLLNPQIELCEIPLDVSDYDRMFIYMFGQIFDKTYVFHCLPKNKKAKLKPYLFPQQARLHPDIGHINYILSCIRMYLL